MAELIGKSIQELTQAPVLNGKTCIAVQREGASKAEKTQLSEVAAFIRNEEGLVDAIQKEVSTVVKTDISAHSQERDPHGDRAYTNSVFNGHLLSSDPHGDKVYTDTQIKTHSKASDPHGDRAYTNTAINIHSTNTDPHGDRAYANTAIAEHSTALDPHGDRAYTLSSILSHNIASDPHGDRLYADNKLLEHKNEADPHGLLSKIVELIDTHNRDNSAHEIDKRLVNLDTTVTNLVNTLLNQKIGNVIPSLSNGVVDPQYLKKTVIINDQASLPTIGEEDVLYINTSSKSISYWDSTRYISLASGGSVDTTTLSTDNIAEGSNPDRQYFTQALKNTLTNKVGTVVTEEAEGIPVFNKLNSTNGKLFLKSLKTEGAISLIDKDTTLLLKTDDYVYTANYSANCLLTSDTTILDTIGYDDLVLIRGKVTATNYKSAGDMRLVNLINTWDVDAVVGTKGTSVPVTKPSGLVISSNGLVITGVTKPTHNVEIYSSDNELLGTGTSLTEGSFTVVLSTAELRGRRLKVYTVTPEGDRSEPTYFFTNNTTSLVDTTAISISKDGTKLYGVSARNAEVKIYASDNTEIGSGKANDFGNFAITLTKALISNDTIRITTKLGTSLTKTLDSYVVTIKDIQTPYNVTYNYERTVFTGYAEPNSQITFSVDSIRYLTTTDEKGLWTVFSFTTPVQTNKEITIQVKQEERIGTTALDLNQVYSSSGTEPLVKEVVSNFETSFIVKSIQKVLNTTDKLTFDLVFNPVTRNVEVRGNTTGTEVINWTAQFNIIRDSITED